MAETPITPAIWKTMMRRYTVAAAVGAPLYVWAFRQLYLVPPGQVTPMWMLILASVGGFLVLGGLFGFSLSLFFHLWHKEDR